MVTSDKPRLYVALYAPGAQTTTMPNQEDKYHWALLLGPKNEIRGSQGGSKGFRFHARQSRANPQIWEYEAADTMTAATFMVLVRIRIAKIKDPQRLQLILQNVPVLAGEVSNWNCVHWVKEALERLWAEGDKVLGTGVRDWVRIRNVAMWYADKKVAEGRFTGNAHLQYDLSSVPTFDLMENRETQI